MIKLDADHVSALVLSNPCPAGKSRCTNLGPWAHPRPLDPGLHLSEVATVKDRVLRLVSSSLRRSRTILFLVLIRGVSSWEGIWTQYDDAQVNGSKPSRSERFGHHGFLAPSRGGFVDKDNGYDRLCARNSGARTSTALVGQLADGQ
jgi:hypothetical protein